MSYIAAKSASHGTNCFRGIRCTRYRIFYSAVLQHCEKHDFRNGRFQTCLHDFYLVRQPSHCRRDLETSSHCICAGYVKHTEWRRRQW